MRLKYVLPCSVLLIVWAVYIPSIQLMLLHDDVINAYWIQQQNLFQLFAPAFSFGKLSGAEGRPAANLFWYGTRVFFGKFEPTIIHAWSVWLHSLNVALLWAFAKQITRRTSIHSNLFAAVATLSFGLFPLSYQAIIWAGSLYHPAMTTFGLLAVVVSLWRKQIRYRWVYVWLLLMAAALSHEAGFVFAAMLIGIHLVAQTRGTKNDFNLSKPILIGSTVIIYPILFRASGFLSNQTSPQRNAWNEATKNAIIFMQSFVAWQVMLLRQYLGLIQNANTIIVILFACSMVLGLVILWRAKLLRVGVISLIIWVLFSGTASLVLDEAYVRFGPRLSYVPAIGIALFWSALLSAVVVRLQYKILKVSVIGAFGFGLISCSGFIQERIREAQRLTPAMNYIHQDLMQVNPNKRVLLINLPWWNAPKNPTFWLGAEGMPLFQHEGPAWLWLHFIDGGSVRHENVTYTKRTSSFVTNAAWEYGTPGDSLADDAMRALLLKNDVSYQFLYDGQGVRSELVGELMPKTSSVNTFVAQLKLADALFLLQQAQATFCRGHTSLNLIWQIDKTTATPSTVFVHGYNAQGKKVANADQDFMQGMVSAEFLPNQTQLREQRNFDVPDHEIVTEIRLGLYMREGGQRWRATHSDNTNWLEDEVTISVNEHCE